MPQNLTCPGCNHAFVVADHLSGQTLACPACGAAVVSEEPLLPPPMSGATPQPPDASAPVVLAPSNAPSRIHKSPAQPAVPAARPVAPSQPPPAPPPRAPAAAPPVSHAGVSHPSPRSGSFDVETHESADRAYTMEKSHRGKGWIFGVLALVVVVAGGIAIYSKLTTVNPSVGSVEESLEPSPQALRMLGTRQRGVGYSFQLPKGFQPADAPSTSGLPDGTRAWAWKASEGTPEAGSELRIWVLPKQYPLNEKLAEMKDTGNRLDGKAVITDRSSYRRVGEDFVAVRGLLSDPNSQGRSVGVLYLLADSDQTVMAIGMGAGPKAKDIQFLLDHSVRTIERE